MSSSAPVISEVASESASGKRSDGCRARKLAARRARSRSTATTRGTDRVDELIHLLTGAPRERANHNLRVDARPDHDFRGSLEPRAQQLDGPFMLIVARVQKGDHNVGVERYSPHSLRSSSR